MYEYFLYRKNQHMILDTCGTECLTVDLGLGSDTSDTARTLDIRVMFSCFCINHLLPTLKPILIYYIIISFEIFIDYSIQMWR